MSAPSESNGRPSDPQAGEGVLANLPRTRPQRSSPRRVAARRANASPGAAAPPPRTRKTPAAESSATASTSSAPRVARAPKPRKSAAKATPKPRARGARAAAPTPVAEQVPRQGFESDFDRPSGSVQPPGGAELVASAAEIVGELAKAGIATGERLLKDMLTRLPLA